MVQSRLHCKQIAMLLKCPRAHFRYIEEHGIHEFIAKCNKILELHQIEQETDQMRNSKLQVRMLDAQ